MNAIDAARSTGTKIVLGCTIFLALMPPLIAALRGGPVLVFLLGAGALVGLAVLVQRGGGRAARMALAAALLGEVMLVTAALSGHPWQTDSHMAYFAAMAILVTLVDPAVLMLGAALVAIQHIGLGALLPGLLYPPAGSFANLQRALLHGAILVAETAVLHYVVRLRQDQAAQAEDDRARVENALQEARGAAETASAIQAAQADVVTALRGALQRLAVRDLETRIDTSFPPDYEQLRSDFNLALSQLGDAVGEAMEKAARIGASAQEISSASDDLSRRTETQAATLEETAAALNELTSSVTAAADRAREVEGIVGEARREAEMSGDVVQSAVSAMTAIEKSSEQISQIVGVIDEIAFQTNLLALNAGVEAARAGEAGKGFTVVASEVRVLAQRSSDAAREIKELISGSTRQVEDGVALVGQAGEALTSIVGRVGHISDLVTEIARGTVEQAQGLSEINTGVNSLDQVTQQNAAMVEESTAAAHSLASEAQGLTDTMRAFRIDGAKKPPTGGGDTGGAASMSPSAGSDQERAGRDRPASAAAVATSGAWHEF
jgi:methyl-accepting chemotaxis protein